MMKLATITQHGEHQQQPLRERVVAAERGLLQREARARVAEDELDEDEAADGGRELRGEAVERREDGVAPGVARHHAPVAQALGVGHRHVVLLDRVDHDRAHVEHPAAGERDHDDDDRQLRVAEGALQERVVEAGRELGVVGVLRAGTSRA